MRHFYITRIIKEYACVILSLFSLLFMSSCGQWILDDSCKPNSSPERCVAVIANELKKKDEVTKKKLFDYVIERGENMTMKKNEMPFSVSMVLLLSTRIHLKNEYFQEAYNQYIKNHKENYGEACSCRRIFSIVNVDQLVPTEDAFYYHLMKIVLTEMVVYFQTNSHSMSEDVKKQWKNSIFTILNYSARFHGEVYIIDNNILNGVDISWTSSANGGEYHKIVIKK